MKNIKLPPTYKYIGVFPTMKCPLSCSYCINNDGGSINRKKFKEISGEDWVRALNRINSDYIPITFSGGEPGYHKDFIDIIKNIKPELKLNLLTNLYWKPKVLKRFIEEINPKRLNEDLKYPSIRASYHPEQMGNGDLLIDKVIKLKNSGFNIGIESVMYPSDEQLRSIEQMSIRCRNEDISFRVKSFAGTYEDIDDKGQRFSKLYGNFFRHPNSVEQKKTKSCLCKTSELIIGPNADIYRCHRDLYSQENPRGNLLNYDFEIQDIFRGCDNYGKCNPCDVKLKTNSNQELGHTSVEIKNVK